MGRDETRFRGRSREILRLVAKGHSYEQILAAIPGLTYRNIFRAAHEALRLLEVGEEESAPGETGGYPDEAPERAGQKWTAEEETELRRMYERHDSLSYTMRSLKRSELAVKARLVRMGLISRAEVPELDELDALRKRKAKPRFES